MSGDLCVQCTMCCNGSLFSRVPLPPSDRLRLGDGIATLERNGKTYMKLGCTFLGADGACGRYEVRPETCRSYRCDLLKRVQRGDLAEPDALRVAKAARQMRAMARDVALDAFSGADQIPATRDPAELVSALKRQERSAPGSVNKYKRRDAVFHLETLNRYVALHFKGRS